MFAYEQLFCGAICESSLDSKVSTVAEPTRVARFLVFVVYAPGGQSLGWRRRTHGADRATQDSSTSIIHHRSLSAMAQTYKGGAFRWDRRRCSTSIMKDNRNNTGRIAALSPRLSPLEKGFTLSYDAEACDSQLANTPLACPLHGEARQLQQQLPHPPRKLFSTLGVNRRRRSRSPLPFGRQGWIEALDSPRVAARGSTCDHGGRKNKLAAAAGAAERSRSPGNGWAEPGKGWSRCHRQGGSRQQRTRRSSAHQRLFSRPSGSSCCGGEWTTQQVVPPQQPTSISQGRCQPGVAQPRSINVAIFLDKSADDAMRYDEWQGAVSGGYAAHSRDRRWAAAYLTGGDGLEEERRRTDWRGPDEQTWAEDNRKLPWARWSTSLNGDDSGSTTRQSSQLEEAQKVKHDLSQACSHNLGLMESNAELARKVVALRRRVETLTGTISSSGQRHPYAGWEDQVAEESHQVRGPGMSQAGPTWDVGGASQRPGSSDTRAFEYYGECRSGNQRSTLWTNSMAPTGPTPSQATMATPLTTNATTPRAHACQYKPLVEPVTMMKASRMSSHTQTQSEKNVQTQTDEEEEKEGAGMKKDEMKTLPQKTKMFNREDEYTSCITSNVPRSGSVKGLVTPGGAPEGAKKEADPVVRASVCPIFIPSTIAASVGERLKDRRVGDEANPAAGASFERRDSRSEYFSCAGGTEPQEGSVNGDSVRVDSVIVKVDRTTSPRVTDTTPVICATAAAEAEEVTSGLPVGEREVEQNCSTMSREELWDNKEDCAQGNQHCSSSVRGNASSSDDESNQALVEMTSSEDEVVCQIWPQDPGNSTAQAAPTHGDNSMPRGTSEGGSYVAPPGERQSVTKDQSLSSQGSNGGPMMPGAPAVKVAKRTSVGDVRGNRTTTRTPVESNLTVSPQHINGAFGRRKSPQHYKSEVDLQMELNRTRCALGLFKMASLLTSGRFGIGSKGERDVVVAFMRWRQLSRVAKVGQPMGKPPQEAAHNINPVDHHFRQLPRCPGSFSEASGSGGPRVSVKTSVVDLRLQDEASPMQPAEAECCDPAMVPGSVGNSHHDTEDGSDMRSSDGGVSPPSTSVRSSFGGNCTLDITRAFPVESLHKGVETVAGHSVPDEQPLTLAPTARIRTSNTYEHEAPAGATSSSGRRGGGGGGILDDTMLLIRRTQTNESSKTAGSERDGCRRSRVSGKNSRSLMRSGGGSDLADDEYTQLSGQENKVDASPLGALVGNDTLNDSAVWEEQRARPSSLPHWSRSRGGGCDGAGVSEQNLAVAKNILTVNTSSCRAYAVGLGTSWEEEVSSERCLKDDQRPDYDAHRASNRYQSDDAVLCTGQLPPRLSVKPGYREAEQTFSGEVVESEERTDTKFNALASSSHVQNVDGGSHGLSEYESAAEGVGCGGRDCEHDTAGLIPRHGTQEEGESSGSKGNKDCKGGSSSSNDGSYSYRRDCAVLAGTAKIVFALSALEYRRISSRFYHWKRVRRMATTKTVVGGPTNDFWRKRARRVGGAHTSSRQRTTASDRRHIVAARWRPI